MNYSKSNAISVFFRAPEPQQPQPEVADDIIHSDNSDPDEDDEYYKKQLSYFDRRSFDNKPPNPQLTPIIKPAQPQSQPGYYPRYKLNTFVYLIQIQVLTYSQVHVLHGMNLLRLCSRLWFSVGCHRADSVEKTNPVPPVNPAVPPPTLPKPTGKSSMP